MTLGLCDNPHDLSDLLRRPQRPSLAGFQSLPHPGLDLHLRPLRPPTSDLHASRLCRSSLLQTPHPLPCRPLRIPTASGPHPTACISTPQCPSPLCALVSIPVAQASKPLPSAHTLRLLGPASPFCACVSTLGSTDPAASASVPSPHPTSFSVP